MKMLLISRWRCLTKASDLILRDGDGDTHIHISTKINKNNIKTNLFIEQIYFNTTTLTAARRAGDDSN